MTNPNKVNQYTAPDPRQSLFFKKYFSPKSLTFANMTQSAMGAGYSKEYAENLSSKMPKWLSEKVMDMRLIKNAEKRLNQVLELEPIDDEGKIDNSLIANQMKGINLVLKGLQKERFSERQEHTGANGSELQPILVEIIDKKQDDKKENNSNTQ